MGSGRFRTGDRLSRSDTLLCAVLGYIGTGMGGISSEQRIESDDEAGRDNICVVVVVLAPSEVGECVRWVEIPPTSLQKIHRLEVAGRTNEENSSFFDYQSSRITSMASGRY